MAEPLEINDPREHLVGTDEALGEFCRHARSEGLFAFDSEFIRERTYTPRVCLVQAATRSSLALIDPDRLDIRPFWDLVTSAEVETVLFAGKQDLEICHLWTGRAPARIVDLQVAAGFAGLPHPASYGRLVRETLGVELEQAETFTDWSRRPLSMDQLRYAVEDVLYLLPLYDHLLAALEALGRADWLREEMRVLEAEETYAADERDAYLRVRGCRRLEPRQLAILRVAAQWRERMAQRRNVPARTYLRDECLIEVARRAPRTKHALGRLRGFPRAEAERFGQELLDAVRRARRLPADRCPVLRPDPAPEPPVSFLALLAMAAGESLCDEAGVSPRLVGKRSDYVALAAHALGLGAEYGEAALLGGWRGEFVGRRLVSLLKGDRAVRVAGDPPHLTTDPSPPATPPAP